MIEWLEHLVFWLMVWISGAMAFAVFWSIAMNKLNPRDDD
jgi:hypothetical protein